MTSELKDVSKLNREKVLLNLAGVLAFSPNARLYGLMSARPIGRKEDGLQSDELIPHRLSSNIEKKKSPAL